MAKDKQSADFLISTSKLIHSYSGEFNHLVGLLDVFKRFLEITIKPRYSKFHYDALEEFLRNEVIEELNRLNKQHIELFINKSEDFNHILFLLSDKDKTTFLHLLIAMKIIDLINESQNKDITINLHSSTHDLALVCLINLIKEEIKQVIIFSRRNNEFYNKYLNIDKPQTRN